MAVSKKLAFSTLLKLLQLSELQRRNQLRRRLSGGGYSFWRPLAKVAQKILLPDADLSSLQIEIEQSSSEVQGKHNKAALKKVWDLIHGKHQLIAALPELVLPFGASGFSVRLEPEVCCEIAGQPTGIQIWATTRPPLSDDVLSVGLAFLKAAYGSEGYSHVFAIFDSIKPRLFREANIAANVSDLQLAFEEMLATDWAAIIGAAEPKDEGKTAPPPSS